MTTRPTPPFPLPSALLLDMDGTCIDSEPIWEHVERTYVNAHGAELKAEHRRRMIGAPMWMTTQIIAEISGVDHEPEELETTLVHGVAERLRTVGVPWIEGIASLMSRMRSHGVPVVLVTASHAAIVDVVAADAPSGGFDALVTGDDRVEPKPSPAPYLLGAHKVDADIRRCLIIEDSNLGVRGALASGARVLGIPRCVDMEYVEGVNRLHDVRDLDDATLARIMSGEDIDVFSGVTAQAPYAVSD